LALLFYLLEYAERRKQLGQLDVASLVHYRCIELITQHRLAKYGIDTSAKDVDLSGFSRDAETVLNRYREEVGENVATIRGPVDLMTGVALLVAGEGEDDSLFDRQSKKQIRGRVFARNTCLFAHGFSPVSEKQLIQLEDSLEKLVDRILELEPVSGNNGGGAGRRQYKFVEIPRK
ncbi:MAG: hypothetical protein ACTSU5_17335, partial [Promethearchaeota archaeon]